MKGYATYDGGYLSGVDGGAMAGCGLRLRIGSGCQENVYKFKAQEVSENDASVRSCLSVAGEVHPSFL